MKISFRLGEKYGKVLIMGFGIVGMVIQVYVSSHMPSITLFLFLGAMTNKDLHTRVKFSLLYCR